MAARPENDNGSITIRLNKKVAVAALAGVIAATGGVGYLASQGGQKSPDQSPYTPSSAPQGLIENQSQTASQLPYPDSSSEAFYGPSFDPEQSPKPNLSMEQQASNAVFDYWLSLIDKTQVKEEGQNSYYLKTTPQNFDEWKHNIDIIKNGGTADSPLILNWVGGELMHKDGSATQSRGIKSQGIAVLTNISMHTDKAGVTNQDKQNGMTWKGDSAVIYNFVYSENEYWPTPNTPFAPDQNVKDWLLKPESDPYWAPSDKLGIAINNIDANLQNGTWEIPGVKEFISTSSTFPLAYVARPFLLAGDPGFCQDPKAVSSCNQIIKDITY